MHPFLNEQIAQMHRQELLREAVVARLAEEVYIDAEGNSGAGRLARERWGLIFGLPVLSSSINQAWLQRRMRSVMFTVGLGAFGVGSLVGSFLGSRLGLLPAVVFSCVVCLAIMLPMVGRWFIAIMNFDKHVR